jgi:hypothetical protein
MIGPRHDRDGSRVDFGYVILLLLIVSAVASIIARLLP